MPHHDISFRPRPVGCSETTNIMIVASGKLTRSKLSCSAEDKAAILAGGIAMIREHSVTVDEIVGDDKAGLRVTGALHNFEPGKIAFATVSATGPAKVWMIPGDKFRAIIAKPEYAMAMMAFLATEVRSGSKSIRKMLTELKQGVVGGSEEHETEIKVLCYDVSARIAG
jgi:CRP-like cAMP-binding protein